MTDEQIVRQWFLRLLADFRIYSPLYKVMVEKVDDSYIVVGHVERGEIRTVAWVRNGTVLRWFAPTMHWIGEHHDRDTEA